MLEINKVTVDKGITSNCRPGSCDPVSPPCSPDRMCNPEICVPERREMVLRTNLDNSYAKCDPYHPPCHPEIGNPPCRPTD